MFRFVTLVLLYFGLCLIQNQLFAQSSWLLKKSLGPYDSCRSWFLLPLNPAHSTMTAQFSSVVEICTTTRLCSLQRNRGNPETRINLNDDGQSFILLPAALEMLHAKYVVREDVRFKSWLNFLPREIDRERAWRMKGLMRHCINSHSIPWWKQS